MTVVFFYHTGEMFLNIRFLVFISFVTAFITVTIVLLFFD